MVLKRFPKTTQKAEIFSPHKDFMAGRRPKPTALKLIAGNPGHRPINKDEPQPDAVDENLKPPRWLSGEARAVWDELLPRMLRNSLITDIDVIAFARYCQNCGRYAVAESYIAKQGEVMIVGEGGMPFQNPYLAVSNRAAEMMAKGEAAFGMNPSDRTRVAGPGGKKKANRFLDLVNAGKPKSRA
jgi:P27 family predicted phage terminase small subunit